MPKQQAKKSGGAKKYGRSKDKCLAYKNAKTAERAHCKRVLVSSGLEACKKYAAEHGVNMPRGWTEYIAKRHRAGS